METVAVSGTTITPSATPNIFFVPLTASPLITETASESMVFISDSVIACSGQNFPLLRENHPLLSATCASSL